jgi:type III restriction enzyme
VENGFEPLEAEQLVQESERQQQASAPLFSQSGTDGSTETQEPTVEIETRETPNLNQLPNSTRQKVTADPSTGTVTYRGDMSADERDALKACFSDPDVQYQVEQAQQRLREKAGGRVTPPVENGATFEVPQLAVRQGDAFEVFRETHITDTDWRLSDFEATLPGYEPSRPQGQRGAVDADEEGGLNIRFLDDVRRQLTMLSDDRRWSVSDLVVWLDRSIPHPDIRPQDSVAFLERLVQNDLLDEQGFSLDALVRDKYSLKRAVEKRIDEHREAAHDRRFQRLLWGGDGEAAVAVRPDVCFSFDTEYPYRALYDGDYEFVNHYYEAIGQMNGEEAECAFFLDRQPEIDYWVRNLSQNRKHGFWLQTASAKFYPDFVCRCEDGRVLVVEYKGEQYRGRPKAEGKKNIGEVWAKRSDGHCLFGLVGKDDHEDQIRSLLE